MFGKVPLVIWKPCLDSNLRFCDQEKGITINSSHLSDNTQEDSGSIRVRIWKLAAKGDKNESRFGEI